MRSWFQRRQAESSGQTGPGSRPVAVAEQLFRAGRLGELAGLDPAVPEIRLWQAGGLARQGRREEAIAALRDLRRRHPGFQPARTPLSRLLLLGGLRRAEQGDWPGAASALAEARAVGNGLGTASTAAALVFVLAGRRSEARTAFEEARRRDPADGRLAHALFLVCYHTARAVGPRGLEVETWEQAIASWAALLHDERFWEEWRARAWTRYQAKDEPLTAPVAELRRQIEERMRAFLDSALDETAQPQRLKALLRRELKGAELLRSNGGFPLPGRGGAVLLCGPLMIRFLKLERELGDFVAACAHGLTARRREAAAERSRELRICFSSLGGARVLLDLGSPREALRALAQLACPLCCGSRPGKSAVPCDAVPTVCADTCSNFDAFNPGYAGLPDKASALAADALELAVEAHLAVAQAAITISPMDLETAKASWRQARQLAIPGDREEEVCRRIAELVLRRVMGLEIPARVHEAVILLEAAEEVCSGCVAPDLIGRLAELLTVRGIEAANDLPSRWEEAVNDLRRAVRYNAYFPHAVLNLGRALRGWAAAQDEPAAAATLLEEAVQELDEGTRRFPERNDIAEELRAVREELAEVWRWLRRTAR